MKIEMGESLFYSWLRHVKECQVVQTNWKVSPQWNFQHENELQQIMETADKHFRTKYGYRIFKQNSSLSQIIQQGECDAIGISVQNGINKIYAVDVAFHSAGLNYGSREETVMKVIAKSIRTAMCLYGYMQSKSAEIIFASPKITPAILNDIIPCIKDANDIFNKQGFNFTIRVIANEDFNNSVLQPILLVSKGVADTSELFIRSFQMFSMFANSKSMELSNKVCENEQAYVNSIDYKDRSIYRELKIGKLVSLVLRKILEEELADENEIKLMQTTEYSKEHFDVNYPVLVRTDSQYDAARYYVKSLLIRGVEYKLCSQWFETEANNDRPYLMKWIDEHIAENK